MSISTQAQAKKNAIAFIREARAAGWDRTKIEFKPDGTLMVDASMHDEGEENDFLNNDLRMGE